MTDIIERAEDCLRYHLCGEFIVRDLVAELKAARAKVRYLELSIKEEVSSLTPEERAEIDSWEATR